MEIRDVVIVAAVRSAVARGKKDGSLAATHPIDLSAAVMKDAGTRATLEAAMAKLYSSEIAVRASEDAVQIHGGYGFVKEYHVERLMRDAKITQIYEGTSEVQKIVISRQVLNAQ